MRRIALALMSTLSGLVLLFSYHTSTNSGTAVAAEEGTASAGSSSSGDTSGDASGDTSGSTSGSSSDGGSGADGTYTGDAVQTRWGPVQVEITVENGEIVSSDAVVYPQENHRDVEINSYAVPVYNEEAVDAQSSDIDAISGATVTWQGYTESLQSAIDQAGI